MKRPPLYHLTSEPWWMLIAQQETLLSMSEKKRRGVGQGPLGNYTAISHPQVSEWDEALDSLVWFTSNKTPVQQWQEPIAGIEPQHKGAVRLQVDVPWLVRWETHARQIGFPRSYYEALDNTGMKQSHLWWVSPVPVPIDYWIEAVRTSDGIVLWDRA